MNKKWASRCHVLAVLARAFCMLAALVTLALWGALQMPVGELSSSMAQTDLLLNLICVSLVAAIVAFLGYARCRRLCDRGDRA